MNQIREGKERHRAKTRLLQLKQISLIHVSGSFHFNWLDEELQNKVWVLTGEVWRLDSKSNLYNPDV